MPLQLWPQGTLDKLITEIVNAVAQGFAGFDAGAGRRTLELMLRCRVSQTMACGTLPACAAPGRDPAHEARPCVVDRDDAHDLARIFAAETAGRLPVEPSLRPLAERRICAIILALLDPLIVENERCRHARGCRAPTRDPFTP